jgi:hypothetical protein
MPATYTLISSNVLTSSQASVTFSAIPATYTDLVVRFSARSENAAIIATIRTRLNGSTSSIYSLTRLVGDPSSSSASSSGVSSGTGFTSTYAVADSATSNTFSSGEIYIPSYTASQNKPISTFSVSENNSTEAYEQIAANLFSSTSAISSISFDFASGINFLTGSSFYLYGISNS